MTNVTLPAETGIDGRTQAWSLVTGVGETEPLATDVVDRLPLGSIVAQHAVGRFVPGWDGFRLWWVNPDSLTGLTPLHPGFFRREETDGWNAAVAAALAGDFSRGFPGPRNVGGRRRDHRSASSAPRWMQCPASVRLCDEAAREDTGSEYADLGTAAHEMAENCLVLGADAADMTGVLTGVGIETVEDMVEHVQVYLDTIRADEAADGGTVQMETSSSVLVDGAHYHGTFDALLWSPETRTLRVYDLKYGQGVLVDVRENEQLRIYAIGGMRLLGADGAKVKHVEIVIVQPRRADGSGDVVRRERLTAEELSLWYADSLVPAARLTEHSEAPFSPSEGACRWCPAAHACPALREKTIETAQSVFSLAPSGADLTAAAVVAAEMKPKDVKARLAEIAATVEPERIAEILTASPLVSLWLSAVEEHARGLLEHGTPVPGFKLVQKVGNRTWKDEDAVVDAICVATGLDPSECFSDPVLLSPAQMEKRVPKEQREIVETLTHRPDRGVTMVPENDKRPAVDRSAAAVFGTVES